MTNKDQIQKLRKEIKRIERRIAPLDPEGFVYMVIKHRQLELELELLELKIDEKTSN